MADQLGRTTDPDLALAARLRNLAANLEAFPHYEGHRDCGCLRCRARTYSERGYPAVTIGDGGSRNSDSTSSTERTALTPPDHETARLAGYPLVIDTLDTALVAAQTIVAWVLKHGTTDDWIPAGQGPCVVPTCDHICNPHKNQNDLRRSGLCPACHQAWLRYQRRHTGAERPAFLAWRAKELAPEPRTNAKGQHVAQNVPT